MSSKDDSNYFYCHDSHKHKSDTSQKESSHNDRKDKRNNVYRLKDATCTVSSRYPFFFVGGSGFFIKSKCEHYIVTCAHVVTETLSCFPSSGFPTCFHNGFIKPEIYIDVQNVNGIPKNHQQIKCEIVGVDNAADIAVLRPLTKEEDPNAGYNLKNHPYLTFGNSKKTKNGSKCSIIGNAIGIDTFSIADGVVRDNKFVFTLPTESLLISAPAWSGNSGSPVLDDWGRVIGMVCYSFRTIYEESSTLVGGASQCMMEKIIRKIIICGEDNTSKGYIGIPDFLPVSDFALIFLREQFPEFAEGNLDVLKGLLVLYADIPATTATIPIERLDIITHIKDLCSEKEFDLGNLDHQYHFSRITWFKRPGSKVELTVTRPGTNTTFKTIVTVAKYPEYLDFIFANVSGNKKHNNGNENENVKPNNKIEIKVNGTNYLVNTLTSIVKKDDI